MAFAFRAESSASISFSGNILFFRRGFGIPEAGFLIQPTVEGSRIRVQYEMVSGGVFFEIVLFPFLVLYYNIFVYPGCNSFYSEIFYRFLIC